MLSPCSSHRAAQAPPRLRTSGLALATLAALASGCGDHDTPASGAALALSVAPLSLPGVAGACYDIQVINGADEYVWSAGDPANTYPTDWQTICSWDFGITGGSLTYIGPCDASAPESTVHLYIDSLWDADGNPIEDYVDPCADPGGCVEPAYCVENDDVQVSFDLTVMRRSQKGFFDVGVEFRDVFCSAKLDCSYDPAGEQPISLLNDPTTGQRGQTAVVALDCTAGPGQETILQISDVVVTCGDPFGLDPWSATASLDRASFCLDPVDEPPQIFAGSMAWDFEYPALTDFGSGVVGAIWTASDDGSSSFSSAAFPSVDAHGNTYDAGFPERLLGTSEDGTVYVLGRLARGGNPYVPAQSDGEATLFSSLSAMTLTVLARSPLGWSSVQDLSLPGSQMVDVRDVDEVTRAIVAVGTNDGVPYVYPRTADTTTIAYQQPMALVPPGWSCELTPPSQGLVAGYCNSGSGNWAPVILDLRDVANGQPLPYVFFGLPTFGEAQWTATTSWHGPLPVILDGAHVAFDFQFHDADNWYSAQQVVLVTGTGNGWVAETPFSSGSSWTQDGNSWCSGGNCLAHHGNGVNGVLWGQRLAGNYGYQDRFILWASASGSTHLALDGYGSYAEVPFAGWTEGEDAVVFERAPGGGVRLAVYHGDGSGPSVSEKVLADVNSVKVVRPTADGYQIVFDGGGTRLVEAHRVVSELELGPAPLAYSLGEPILLSSSLAVDSRDPAADASLANDALNPAPCASLTFAGNGEGAYHQKPSLGEKLLMPDREASKKDGYYSRWASASITVIDPTTGARTTLPHLQDAPDYPLEHVILARQSATGLCYADAGGPTIVGHYANVDVDKRRASDGGVVFNQVDVGVGGWTSGGTFTHLVTDWGQLPKPPRGQFYQVGFTAFAGADEAGASKVYNAIGDVAAFDAVDVRPPTEKEDHAEREATLHRPAVFEQTGSGWRVAQLLEEPDGVDPGSTWVEGIDAHDRMLVGGASRPGRGVILFWKRDASAAGLRYGAPIEVVPPSGYVSCGLNTFDDAGGAWLMNCGGPTGSGWFAVSEAMLGAPGSTVTPAPLPIPSGASWVSDWRGAVSTPSGPALLAVAYGNFVDDDDGSSYWTSKPFTWRWDGEGWVVAPVDPRAGAYTYDTRLANGFVSYQWSSYRASSSRDVVRVGDGARWTLPLQDYVLDTWTDEGGLAMAFVYDPTSSAFELYELPSDAGTPGLLASATRPSSMWGLSALDGFRATDDGYAAFTTQGDSTSLGHLIHLVWDGSAWSIGFTKLGNDGLGVTTTIAAASNGVDIASFTGSGTLAVGSTAGFPSGGTLLVATNQGNAELEYTGKTETSFTGCYTKDHSAYLATGGAVSFMPDLRLAIDGDASWSLDLAEQRLNPRPCAAIPGASSYYDRSTDTESRQGLWFDLSGLPASAEPDQVLRNGALLPTDPVAPSGTSSYYFMPPASSRTTTVLDAAIGPGNAYRPATPDPDPADPIWQYATYMGSLALPCGDTSCNDLYWNIAIGFDPQASNCTIELMATAGTASDFDAAGQPVTTGTWPVIHYTAALTGNGGTDNLACTQNPLDGAGSGVTTQYVTGARFCHSFDGELPASALADCDTVFPLWLASASEGVAKGAWDVTAPAKK